MKDIFDANQKRHLAIFEIVELSISEFLYIFSDISERNNDYSDTLDFRRGSVGEVGGGHIFRFGGP